MPLSLLLCQCPRYTLWYSVMQKTCHYALPSTPSHPTTPYPYNVTVVC
jgi:hypothetical protein